MNTVFTFTPEQLGGAILAFCAAIVSVSAAISVIARAVSKAMKPSRDQDTRIEVLEKRVDKHDEYFMSDKKRFDSLEADIHALLITNMAMLDHSIDGNNIKQLKSAKEDLQKYLIER